MTTQNSPTKDDEGYMKMYHFITMNLIRQRLNGCEHCIVLLLLRMTLGYGEREETKLSQEFIAQCTGYHKVMISRSMTKLLKRKLIIRTGNYGLGKVAIYRFNMDIEEWKKPQPTSSLSNEPFSMSTKVGEKGTE